MASLEVDFIDGELERIWSEYVDALTKSLEEGKENTQDDSEIG
jgi:hypothetical protein